MDTTEAPPYRRWLLRIFSTFSALLLLYVLSSGPVLAYFQSRWAAQLNNPRQGPETLEFEQMVRVLDFYKPLIDLAHETGLEKPFGAYIEWWTASVFRFTGADTVYGH
jgi:hypothetical protein